MQPSDVNDDFIRRVLMLGLYSVTPNGDIISHVRRKPRTLKQSLMDDGYTRVGLSCDGIVRYVKVHRIVAIAWIENPDDKPFVNHKDGRKTNNAPWNLEWSTTAENNEHARETGLVTYAKGEKLPHTKLTERQIAEIRALAATKTLTQKEIGARYDIKQNTVSMIVNRKNWKELSLAA